MFGHVLTAIAITIGGILLTLSGLAYLRSGKHGWRSTLRNWVGAKPQSSFVDEFFLSLPKRETCQVGVEELLDHDITSDARSTRIALLKVAAMRDADELMSEIDEMGKTIPQELIQAREAIDNAPVADESRLRNLIVSLNAEVSLTRMGWNTKTGDSTQSMS